MEAAPGNDADVAGRRRRELASSAAQGVATALKTQEDALLAHAQKRADAQHKYPKDRDLEARHPIQVKDGGFGAGGWSVEGLLGVTADLFVIDTTHDVPAVRDALSAAYAGQLQVAVFEREECLQRYKQHPKKREIKIKRVIALDGLPQVPQQQQHLPRAGTKGYLGCASDFLR